jgi:hypothetical protein
VDMEGRERALARRGRGRSGDGPKAARSRGPGWFNCFGFCSYFCYRGDVWVVGGEASSAGRGQEAGNLVVYMPWPQAAVCNMRNQTNKHAHFLVERKRFWTVRKTQILTIKV